MWEESAGKPDFGTAEALTYGDALGPPSDLQQRTALTQWQALVRHPHDLAGAIRVPRKPGVECRAPEDHEVARIELAAHAAGHRGLAVLLGLYLRMRVSEIAAATWSGYDGRTWTWTRNKGGTRVTKPVNPRLAQAAEKVAAAPSPRACRTPRSRGRC